MGQYADIYITVKTRSKQQATDFLNHFFPNRVESADEYEFPQYSSPGYRGFKTVNELMLYLESEVNAEYNLYWKATDDSNPNRSLSQKISNFPKT